MTVTVPPPEVDEDERYRLMVLRSLELLDTPPEPEFDALVDVARHAFRCPIALVSLVDEGRQWFKARCGLSTTQTPREFAFCDHAIRAGDLMVVPDATADPRFAANPLVTGPPRIRFYAGMPLHGTMSGDARPALLGTLCVIDTVVRELSDEEAQLLRRLARIAEALIRARAHVGDAVRYAEERRAAAALLDRQHRQLGQAQRIAEIGSWRMTWPDRHIEWSDQVFAIHGLKRRDVGVDEALLLYPPAMRARLIEAVEKARDAGESFDIELDFTTRDGSRRRVRAMGEVERGAPGAPIAMNGVMQDITARYMLEEALRRSATHDELTGIANRAGFNQEFASRVRAAEATRKPLAVALIDLDGFKAVNDVHGHAAGDRLLQKVARRLRAPHLAGCFPARLGGDEFALLLTRRIDSARSSELVARLLADLRQPADLGMATVAISGTIGVAWHEPGLSADDMLHRADVALYEGKRAGKGRAQAHPIAPDRRLADRRAG